MKRRTNLLFLATLCLFVKCKNGDSRSYNEEDTLNKTSIDSIGVNLISQPDIFIRAKKEVNSQICLEYQLRGDNKHQKFCFKYFDYSDVIFPDTSMAIINKSGVYRTSNYYLFNDSILVLPLIGMNNFLSVYFLNLQSKEIISSDVRTHFSLVWVNEEDKSLILSDSPASPNDLDDNYNVNVYRVENGSLSLVKRKAISIPAILRGDVNEEKRKVSTLYFGK